ncbi:hypothetical protein [Paractinoplanes rishiriensis]|uniref:Uncharacterized protein n=1 Tax=Paractinoplanes rishiriensis TaxID=1050105 RepID=A0A919JSR0_9ACTN|nr:hypothetical protein [Actinoplanes rishiriensis]GIE94140.1 hypothetical protein Ari01nite_16050 [Actinoplanes rishiriensis]
MVENDPFAGLAEWAAKTERKVHRRRLLRRLPAFLGVAVVLGLLAFATPAVWRALTTDYEQPHSTVTLPATTDPFAGTPAAAYPKGAAGITMPAATAVAGFTVSHVDAALRKVRQALIAARLDPRMLTGHDPSGLITLLAANQREKVRREFRDRTFLSFATWIDPAVRLDPHEQPRVSGRVTYRSVTVDGLRTLRVITNFVWVYAFDRADRADRPLAAAHEEIHWEFPSTANLQAGDHGMWLGDVQGYTAWVDCAAADRGLLAPTPPGPAPTDDEDLLRADHTLDIDGNCRTTSNLPRHGTHRTG